MKSKYAISAAVSNLGGSPHFEFSSASVVQLPINGQPFPNR